MIFKIYFLIEEIFFTQFILSCFPSSNSPRSHPPNSTGFFFLFSLENNQITKANDQNLNKNTHTAAKAETVIYKRTVIPPPKKNPKQTSMRQQAFKDTIGFILCWLLLLGLVACPKVWLI